jgi:hypothetical protein
MSPRASQPGPNEYKTGRVAEISLGGFTMFAAKATTSQFVLSFFACPGEAWIRILVCLAHFITIWTPHDTFPWCASESEVLKGA